ncbi:unnamed protein product [Urochloa decumbens]|uniref:KIB1-4 beta-propeller domain-containing protein n=1 Tax=Urochloa decumbens TaxID=240449 RepID=A0ABC9AX90_9POAL
MGARTSKSRQPIPESSSASSSSPWMDLQPDLVELILRCLTSHADRVRFAAVCRHWRFVAREYSVSRLPPPLPWISFRGGQMETLTLKDGDVGERHFIGFREEAVRHGSFGNWQMFQEKAVTGRWRSRHHRHYLRNPLSGATVLLPGHCKKPMHLNEDGSHGKPSIWQTSFDFDISKVIVCSDDLIAAIVLYHRHPMATREVVVCCRPGMSSWSRGLYNIDHYYVDMAFYDGKLYTVTREGRLFVHELAWSGRSTKAKPRVNQILEVSLAAPASLGGFFTSPFSNMSCYLVISNTGKLLMVRWVLPYGNSSVAVKVFQADFETSQWLELKRLDGQVLFISPNCSKAISTSGHGGYPKGNRIYFLDYSLTRSCFPNTYYYTCLYYMRSKKFDPISVGLDISYAWDAAWFFP